MVVFDLRDLFVALYEKFVVIEVAGVAWDSEILPHVDALGHLFAGNEGLVEFFAVACADDFYLCL